MDDDSLLGLQTAWNNPQQKDKYSLCLNDLERAYWQGKRECVVYWYSIQ